MSDVTLGVFKSMSNGHLPREIVSDNIRITVRKDLLSDVPNITYSSPLTTAEAQYGGVASSLHLTSNDYTACDTGSNYVKTATATFGKSRASRAPWPQWVVARRPSSNPAAARR